MTRRRRAQAQPSLLPSFVIPSAAEQTVVPTGWSTLAISAFAASAFWIFDNLLLIGYPGYYAEILASTTPEGPPSASASKSKLLLEDMNRLCAQYVTWSMAIFGLASFHLGVAPTATDLPITWSVGPTIVFSVSCYAFSSAWVVHISGLAEPKGKDDWIYHAMKMKPSWVDPTRLLAAPHALLVWMLVHAAISTLYSLALAFRVPLLVEGERVIMNIFSGWTVLLIAAAAPYLMFGVGALCDIPTGAST